jgi:drug/metabolite transporter (DMT)-like permease
MTAPRGRAELAIIVTAFLWGSTFVVVKEALADISTFLFLAIRFLAASVLLLVVYRGRFSGPGSPRLIRQAALVVGGLLFLGYALQTTGLRYTTASKSAFLTAFYIVLVPFFSSIVNKTRPRAAELAGAVLACAGTFLLTAGETSWSLEIGDLLTLGSAAAFAAHMLAVERYSRRMSYELLAVLQVAGVGALSVLAVFGLETPRVVWSGRVWFALGLTSVFATAVSFALYTWAQRHTTATRAAVLFSLEPVFAGLTAWLAAGEGWTARSLAGGGLVLAGILTVELKPGGARANR